jgi:4-amino-4-deoxy-L-arabinose transferase-like glycosyltransferase
VAGPPEVADAAPPRVIADRVAAVLFALALLVYLASRLIGLGRFPIYFFGDEAVQSVQAGNLVHQHFRELQTGQWMPTYLRNGLAYNIGLSVYAQVLPYLVFGHRLFVTRGVGVAFGLLAAAGVGWLLRNVFRRRFWWLGPLVLGVTPTWFLHSRTAFELVLAVAFYTWFLYFYLRYRQGSRSALFAAVLAAALAFYSYNTIQPVLAATIVLLLLSDLPYHLRRGRWILPAALLAAACAVPYVRFLRVHPGETRRRLEEVNSTWVRPDLSTRQKLSEFGRRYRVAASPWYWYAPENERDLVRHRMKGWGHLYWPTLPFAAAGLGICLWRVRDAKHRAILLALVAAPVGAAMADVLVTRAMPVVVPVAVLTAIGLDAALRGVARVVPERLLAVVAFLGLAALQVVMLRDALVHGPTWYGDYGLYGMQWGQKQVFGEVRDRLRATPGLEVVLSPVWANGADYLADFFLGPRAVRLDSMALLSNDPAAAKPGVLYVMPEEEYGALRGDPKLVVRVEKTIPLPDGRPGFRFARVEPAVHWRELLAAEHEAWHRLETDEVVVGAETWRVARPSFDIGQLADVYDGNPETLVRTSAANPAAFEITFPVPRPVRGVSVLSEPGRLTLKLAREAENGARDELFDPWHGSASPEVALSFPSAVATRRLRIEVTNIDKHEPTHLHVREIRILP